MRVKHVAAACLLISSMIAQSALANIIALDWTTGGGSGASSLMRGWAFSTVAAIQVTDLGWYDADLDGLNSSHQVGIWNEVGTLMALGTVAAGTTGTLDGKFRYTNSLTGVLNLGIGNFVIAGLSTFNDVTFRNIPLANTIIATQISYIEDRVGGSSFGAPTDTQGLDVGYFGPNFKFTAAEPVPAPATLALFGLGLLGLGWSKRKKA